MVLGKLVTRTTFDWTLLLHRSMFCVPLLRRVHLILTSYIQLEGWREFLTIMTQSHLGWGDGQEQTEVMEEQAKPRQTKAKVQLPPEHHTSYIIHHTSYIMHHTSYVIHHTSYIKVQLPPELAAEDQAVQDFL